jgi:hypothetical protein
VGAATPIPDTVFNTDTAYLELSVGGEILLPRSRLLTASYAFNSARVGGWTQGYFVSTGAVTQTIGSTNTWTGTQTFSGSLGIPTGAGPIVDVAGKTAIDTTNDQLLYYGGALRVLPYTFEKCFALENPTADDDYVPIWSPVDAITITSQYCRTQGGTSVGVTISDGTNDMETITCDGDGQADDGSLVNNAFSANERMEFDIGTVVGPVTWVNFCNRYTIDRQ